MEKEIIFFMEEEAEGGYTARALGHSIFTEADNLSELKAMIQEAVRCHFGKDCLDSSFRWNDVKN